MCEASVEMMLESVRIGEVNGMLLMGILGNIGQMKTERFAQTTELDLSLVLETELESLLGDLLNE